MATHTAGFEKPGDLIDLIYEPGTTWSYSDGGANWLGDTLTVAYGMDLNDVMFSRVFDPLGIQPTDLTWRNHNSRPGTINGITRREFSSGIRATVDAMARIGYLYLRRGSWEGQQIVPENFVAESAAPHPSLAGIPVDDLLDHAGATEHYGLLRWNNGDGSLPNVPTDTYWSWGLDDSLIVAIPSLEIVAARAGDGWRAGWNSDYTVVEPFIGPIVAAVTGGLPANEPPAVDAGTDLQIVLPNETLSIAANVTDDAKPAGILDATWALLSGPVAVIFDDPGQIQTNVRFLVDGNYELMMSADDGDQIASDVVAVTVLPDPDPPCCPGCH